MRGDSIPIARRMLAEWQHGGELYRHYRQQLIAYLRSKDEASCADCGHDRRDCRIEWGPDRGDGRVGMWECRECGSVERVEQVWSDRIEA